MGLENFLIRSITKSVKSTIKFENTLDDIISGFAEGCPPKDQLISYIQTKNQVTLALQNVNQSLNILSSVFSPVETAISILSTTVRTIKLLPAPTSVPPGIGIPLNIITTLSDTLDTIGDFLSKNKGLIKVVPEVAGQINNAIQPVLDKLNQLDGLIQFCINSAVEGMTDAEKNQFIDQLNFSLTQTGNFSDPNLNSLNNDILLDRLRPNSNNPLIYQNFRLEIQFDSQNEFSFPSRRVKATNLVRNDIQLFNTDNNEYSYSASTQILIEEAKFRIDRYLQRYPSLASLITRASLTGSVQDTNDPNISGGATGGLGNVPPPAPPPDYTPFTTPGVVDGEVRFKGGKAWRYLGGSQNRWVEHDISFAPFDGKGINGSERYKQLNPPNPFPRDYFKWSELKYKWEFQRRESSSL